MTTLDPRALRDAFGSFMTGVTVVTTRDETGAPVGEPWTFAELRPGAPMVLSLGALRGRAYDRVRVETRGQAAAGGLICHRGTADAPSDDSDIEDAMVGESFHAFSLGGFGGCG